MKLTINPLEHVVVFTLRDITLWSGQGRLQPEDLGLNDAETPPEAVASLGSKRLFPKEKLKALKQMRRRMHTECTAYGGIKFLGGYAVPETKAATLATALDKLVAQGNALRDDLLRNFDATVKAWHDENPQWAHIMRAGTPEKDAVGNRIRFGYHGFVVGTPNNATVAATFSESVAALGDSLYEEVAAEAKTFVAKSLKPGRDAGSQKTAAPVRRMVEKLRGLHFLDPRIGPLLTVFDQVMARIPATGKVDGAGYLALMRCASVLSDVAAMCDIGTRAANGEDTLALADEILGDTPSQQQADDAPALAVDEQLADTPMGAPGLAVEDIFAGDEADAIEAAQPANASAAGCVAGQCAADDAGIDPFHVDDDDPAPPAGAIEPRAPAMVRISALRPLMPTATSTPADGASRAPTTVNRPQPAQPTAPVVPARPAVSRLPTMPTMPTGGSVTMDF